MTVPNGTNGVNGNGVAKKVRVHSAQCNPAFG